MVVSQGRRKSGTGRSTGPRNEGIGQQERERDNMFKLEDVFDSSRRAEAFAGNDFVESDKSEVRR